MEHKFSDIWWLFFSNTHFKLHHCSCRNCRWCKVLLVLRNTVSAGSLVSSGELWVLGAPGKRPWTANPSHKKGHGDLCPSRWTGTQRHGRSWRPKTSMHLDYENIKAQDLLTSNSLLRGTSSAVAFLYGYCIKIKLII